MSIHLVDGKLYKVGLAPFLVNCCFSCRYSELAFAIFPPDNTPFHEVVRETDIGPDIQLRMFCRRHKYTCHPNNIKRCRENWIDEKMQCRKGCWESG